MHQRNKSYSNWIDPYKIVNNKRVYSIKYKGSGVYLIKEKDEIVYIGRSKKDLTNTLYRHFQKWTDLRTDKQSNFIARITYYMMNISNYKVKVVICNNVEDICALEELLIKALEPRDNKLKAQKYNYKYKKIVKSKFSEAGF